MKRKPKKEQLLRRTIRLLLAAMMIITVHGAVFASSGQMYKPSDQLSKTEAGIHVLADDPPLNDNSSPSSSEDCPPPGETDDDTDETPASQEEPEPDDTETKEPLSTEEESTESESEGPVIEYDRQPRSLEDVRSAIELYEQGRRTERESNIISNHVSKYKPRWEFPVDVQLMPDGYHCALVPAGDDDKFPADYYTFFESAGSEAEEIFMYDPDSEYAPGSADNPYQIHTAADLAQLATVVNAQRKDSQDNYYHKLSYRLEDDLDLSSYSQWTPIGIYTDSSSLRVSTDITTASRAGYQKPFMGHFDGNGHTIKNLTISASYNAASGYVRGLFGLVDGARITNLRITQVTINSQGAAGALVGYSLGGTQISDCHVSGKIEAALASSGLFGGIGGLVGYLTAEKSNIYPSIKNCSTDVTLSSSTAYTGGLVGYIRSGNESHSKNNRGQFNSYIVISDCQASGTLQSTKNSTGGLIGGIHAQFSDYFQVSVDNCDTDFSSLTTSTLSGINTGGLIGDYTVEYAEHNQLSVTHCTVSGTELTTGSSSSHDSSGTGGLIGRIYFLYLNETNTSNGTGFNQIDINDCDIYTTTISANSNCTGGIVGLFLNVSSDDSVLNINRCNVYSDDIKGYKTDANAEITGRTGGIIGWYKMSGESVLDGTFANDAGHYRADRTRLFINSCTVEADITTEGRYGHEVGGIAGYLYLDYAPYGEVFVLNCTSKGNISTDGAEAYRVGGIVGIMNQFASSYSKFEMNNCIAYGNVTTTGTNGYKIGGVMGELLYGGSYRESYQNGLAAVVECTANIINCHSYAEEVRATGSGAYYVGGLIGVTDVNVFADRTRVLVENCSSSANVSSRSYYIGGLIGFCENARPNGLTKRPGAADTEANTSADINAGSSMYTTIRNSFATGNVTSGMANVGGLIGHCHAGDDLPHDAMLIENCYASGNVTLTNSEGYNAGGLVGRPTKNTTIRNSYSTGDVYSAGTSTGGFIGYSEGNPANDDHVTIENCYSTGNVTSPRFNAAGFIGHSQRTFISNSYSTGSVYTSALVASDYGCGGFIGKVTSGGRITSSYAAGHVISTAAAHPVGGFIGYRADVTSSAHLYIRDCWFDLTTSGQTSGIGRRYNSSSYEKIIENGVSINDISGIRTSDAIDLDTYQNRFINWSIINNICAVSSSKGIQTTDTPWYIDAGLTYPYLFYQADGFNTDIDSNGHASKPARLDRTSTGDGYLIHTPVNSSTRNYFLANLENTGVLNGTYQALGVKRADYNSNTLVNTQAQYRATTAGAVRAFFPYLHGTSLSDFDSYKFRFNEQGTVLIPASSLYTHTANTLYSFGSVSQTNIFAFASGPYAQKSSDRPAWTRNDPDSYTYVGQAIEYSIYMTNYSEQGRWDNVVMEDPLPLGVTLIGSEVYADYGQGAQPVTYWNQNGSPPERPYYTYGLADSGSGYNNRYMLTVYTGDFEPAEYTDNGLLLDECTITFKALVEREAATSFLPDGSWNGDNIRNKAYCGGDFKIIETGETEYIQLTADDRNTDPVYDSHLVYYNSNYDMDGKSDDDDIQLLKGYYLTDNSESHLILPNDDPEDGSDYTGFKLNSYHFEEWFYYSADGSERITVYPGDLIDPVDQDYILYAQWAMNGALFDFYKTDAIELPLVGAEFELYIWRGAGDPVWNDLVTPDSINRGDWEMISAHISQADAPVTLAFETTGIYQLVETYVPEGYYPMTGQWRFEAEIELEEERLTAPVFIPGSNAYMYTPFEMNDDSQWILKNYALLPLEFIKVSNQYLHENETDASVLEGAEFTLYIWSHRVNRPDDNLLVTDDTIAAGMWQPYADYISDTDGQVRFDLTDYAAIYQLVETKAPQYFGLPSGQWRFEINNGDTVDDLTAAITAIAGRDGEVPPAFKIMDENELNGHFEGQLALVNFKEYGLPDMGGRGSRLFLYIGSLLISLGILCFLWRRLKLTHQMKS